MDNRKKNLLKAYFRWPFITGGLLVVLTVIAFFIDSKVGLYMLIFTAVYFAIALVVYFISRRNVLRKLVDFGAAYAQVQNQLLRQIDIPFAMITSDGELIWSNPAFQDCFEMKKGNRDTYLSNLFPILEHADFKNSSVFHVTYGDRCYALSTEPLNMDNLSELQDLGESASALYNLYMIDETDLLAYKKELEEERNVMALIYLDNYEEVMEDVEYVRRSLLSALLERKLNRYFSSVNGLIRKLEKDRFLVILNQKSLWEIEDGEFSLLEEIKTVNIGNDMPVSISMGIGLGGESIEQNYEFAQAAIDMALGRGGDQAVVKEGSEIHYYGGNVKTTERNTRVKARIKAQALRELIESREAVMIMGHPNSDMDVIGAAMGIYRAAAFSGKRAYIVTGQLTNSVKPLIDAIQNSGGDYGPDLFISEARAKELMSPHTLLVVVDTNRPAYTVCPDLLNRASGIVVMDHHRQGKDRIEDAVLSYVEPYASSASEMVAEVIQYYDDELKLRHVEADAIFAGIVMDTNNFEDKSGVRTFEAAAYLRRNGADVTRVRKLFRDDMEDYRLRAETIHRAELFAEDYLISICPSDRPSKNQTVVAAQAANDLLEVQDIKATFVLTEFENKIYISARSIDEVNVQILMEKMGGGGHASVAGAQLVDTTMEEALQQLKEVILGKSAQK